MSAVSRKARRLYEMYERRFGAKAPAPEFAREPADPAFVLALADRILAAHDVLARLAEKRAEKVVITEVDYPLE
jgi:hypothetical protein